MGKNNSKGPKLQPSFFQQQQQKLGVGFMNKLTSEFIQKNTLKILKDLHSGAIDAEKDYEYFNNYDFVYAILKSVYNNVNYNYYTYIGLTNHPNYPMDINMQRIAAEHYENYNLYNIVASHLNNILNGITMQQGVFTKYYLHQLVSNIRYARNAFNGYFITISEPKQKYIRNERRQLPNDKGNDSEDEGGFFSRNHKSNM